MSFSNEEDDFDRMKNAFRVGGSSPTLSEVARRLEQTFKQAGTRKDMFAHSDSFVSPSRTPKSPVSPRSANNYRSPQMSRSPSPRSPRSGRVGNLAYLASRRASRESDLGDIPTEYLSKRRTSNFLEIPVEHHQRLRMLSLPDTAGSRQHTDQIYRLRTFNITRKGVVNRGDSIVSCSDTSLANLDHVEGDGSLKSSRASSRSADCSGQRSPFDGSCCVSNCESPDNIEQQIKQMFRVLVLGGSSVGKSSLVSQFLTSDYMNTYDASLDDEFGEKSVSIRLDDIESELIFVDHPATEMSAENAISTYQPDACVVVYSVTDSESFKYAEDCLDLLWREHFTRDYTVILVANKIDVARGRCISSENGREIATKHNVKFIEASSGMQHNTDELLVGILKQIRLREQKQMSVQRSKYIASSRASQTINSARRAITRLCTISSKSKSCGNLMVL